MVGRHRSKAKSLTVSLAIGLAAASVLGFAVWLTGNFSRQDTASMAAQMKPLPTTSTPTSTSSSTTTPPPPPPPVTTTPPVAPPPPTTTKPTPKSTKTTPKTTTKAANACSSVLEGTLPHVAKVGNHIAAKFGVDDIGGRAGRAGTSDHPSGLALDFMVDTSTGNAIADYLLANQSEFNVKYVIWRQRYNDGSGWSTMEDRGGATANHYDHVHVSFKSSGSVNVTC
ncbi:hypothetical protein L1857_32165 [Amycolatopsis thermalba]|uniref:ARB-07466-like C-terminal domain-containing protein n=2 Tax=Amycolatopsis thermalba TaxID=944492 RepID=A0ABY4P475_9PSEU|nr:MULTISPECIES: hypothetical protein [Amycolatopsis]UQS27129.1 hypothetical protein L1857_32165 [Amycolatopsis thermalba]